MIRWLSPEERETFCAALRFDPLQDAQLSTLAACFFPLRAYADFWVQTGKDGMTAALARFGRVAYLSAGPRCDAFEVFELLRAVGVSQLETNAVFSSPCPVGFSVQHILPVLQGPKLLGALDEEICLVPPLEKLYDLLAHCDAAFAATATPQEWVWEMSLRIRRGRAQAAALFSDGLAVSMACVLARDEKTSFLGSVATLPGYRHKGYAGRLLRALCTQESACGRTVYLVTREEQLVRYYSSLGFFRQRPLYIYTDFLQPMGNE